MRAECVPTHTSQHGGGAECVSSYDGAEGVSVCIGSCFYTVFTSHEFYMEFQRLMFLHYSKE